MQERKPARISVSNLSYSYGKRQALKAIDMQLNVGEYHVLLGPNGAGKSTLFAILTGLLPVQSGELCYEGRKLTLKSWSEFRSRLAVVFQQSTLDLDLSIEQNLKYHAALHGLPKTEANQRIVAELEWFGLTDRATDRVRSLNGGHRRRVEIARAMLHSPDIVLLDEPTVGLDTQTRHALNKLVRRRCKDQQISVLWSTHLMEEVDESDQITLLNKSGRVYSGKAQGMCDVAGKATLTEAFYALTGYDGVSV